MSEWSTDDDQFIRRNTGRMSDAEMAAILGRSPASVTIRRSRLGVSRAKPTAKGMTPEQVLWAKMHPEHREAGLILLMHREGPLDVA